MAEEKLNNVLRSQIHESEKRGELVVCEESETDIYTDDIIIGQMLNYHIVPPTVEWLEERIFWAPSIGGDTKAWTHYLANLLTQIDANMLICLNRIIFTHDEESDYEAICAEMGVEMYEIPYMDNTVLGKFWSYRSSTIINLSAIKAAVQEQLTGDEGWLYSEDIELRRGVLITLFHGLRYLGLSNPFLDEECYPDSEEYNYEVEMWARDIYEHFFRE